MVIFRVFTSCKFNHFNDDSFSNHRNQNTIFRMCMKSDDTSLYYLKMIEKSLFNLIEHNKLFIKDKDWIITGLVKRQN